ncbi:DNA-binding protein H-NS [Andreprevotia lacus DSM 23236]|uniref:DNA-binding protein H-NS n=1 Tax=Andreprevotia lacus DSM 23236 TaxID=1121001 RepID=A0A1W1X2S8_9NEIS|nr:H-NS histone family protein [Andreprevotia lacus]SMC18252.1 DNA-binding protein H-NS [Andreprevotia lacus DSM 23236]
MSDLSQYTLPELFQLQKDIAATIARRQVEDKKATLDLLKQLAQERGFDLKDLVGGAAAAEPRAKQKGAGVAQYRNPADASATWTGRGRKPLWVIEFLSNGGQLDQLKI